MYASESVNRLLVGNKSDASERHVTKEQGKVRIYTARMRCCSAKPRAAIRGRTENSFLRNKRGAFPSARNQPIHSAELCLQKDNVNVAEAFTKLAAMIKDRLVGAQ